MREWVIVVKCKMIFFPPISWWEHVTFDEMRWIVCNRPTCNMRCIVHSVIDQHVTWDVLSTRPTCNMRCIVHSVIDQHVTWDVLSTL
jgi:hypothetical protein